MTVNVGNNLLVLMNNYLEVPLHNKFTSPKGLLIENPEQFIQRSEPEGFISKVQIGIPRFSEFLIQILEQTRRISPSFRFQSHDGSILEQVLEMYKDCVDMYLKRYTKQLVCHQKNKSNVEVFQDLDIKEDHKARETMKNLLKYEQLLNKKEQSISLKSNKLEEDLENFQIIKENFEACVEAFEEEKKIWFESKMKESERIEWDKRKINNDKNELEKVLENLKVYKENFDKKQADLVESVQKREELLKEAETELENQQECLRIEKSQFQSQKIQFENEKWELESKLAGLDDKDAIYSLKLQHLESEKEEFFKEKERFCAEKSQFEREKHEFNSQPLKSIPFPTEKSSESQQIPYLPLEISHSDQSKDLEKVYSELNYQISRINKSIESRESNLSKRESELNQKTIEYRSIEYSLYESKIHLEEFQLYTICEIEENSQTIKSLIASLKKLKSELEALVAKVFKELNLIKRFSLNLEVIKEEPFESTPEASPKIEIKRGFLDIDDFSSKLKEIENFADRIYTTETFESDLESNIDEKLKEISLINPNNEELL